MEENSQEKLAEDDSAARIDLSRFKHITPGKWEIIDTPSGGLDVGVREGSMGHRPIITFTQTLANVVRRTPRDSADLEAIAMIPEFIEQLRISYDAIDHMKFALEALLEQVKANVLLIKTSEAKESLLKEALYEFKEQLWHEIFCDESENLIHNRGKEGFFISIELANKMYGYFSNVTKGHHG